MGWAGIEGWVEGRLARTENGLKSVEMTSLSSHTKTAGIIDFNRKLNQGRNSLPTLPTMPTIKIGKIRHKR